MRMLLVLCVLGTAALGASPANAQSPPPAAIRMCVDADAMPSAFANPDAGLIPETARVLGRATGSVAVLVTVDPKGHAAAASVVSSDSPYLNAAALDAARRTAYTPATHGCEPVAGRYRYVAQFGEGTTSFSSVRSGKGSKTYSSSTNATTGAASACTPGPAWLKSAPTPSLGPVPLTQPGSATIHAAIDRNGTLTSATPVKSDLPQPYADAALQIVKAGTFAPKLDDACKPQDDVVDISIGFHP
jgi:TonB family protein